MAPGHRKAGSVPDTSSRTEQIVATALELLETEGPEGVTMRAIAQRIGIRAPSLYKHFADKEQLEVAMIAAGLRDSAEVFAAAIDDAADPLASLGEAYRRWALAHPHLYRLMTHRPLPREDLPEGVEAAAAAPVVQVAGGDPDVARALWGFAHGMAALEVACRFPPDADLEAAWRTGISALRGLTPNRRSAGTATA
jgi:AcrR family transcriptional regulator